MQREPVRGRCANVHGRVADIDRRVSVGSLYFTHGVTAPRVRHRDGRSSPGSVYGLGVSYDPGAGGPELDHTDAQSAASYRLSASISASVTTAAIARSQASSSSSVSAG